MIRYLENYGITSVTTFEVIDSTNGNDLRWNVIIDKKYVLRINNNVMTEERVASIDRLCERYRTIGIQTPRLYKNKYGNYILSWMREFVICQTILMLARRMNVNATIIR